MNQHQDGSSFGLELERPTDVVGLPNPSEKRAPNGGVDAGLKSLDHYRRALPPWRYSIRQALLPFVRWETPYLAYLQQIMRSPFLDSYFAIAANLGTHTFFMIGLPILFWCGWSSFGKALVHILASGVFFTGFIKDMCSLPRPLSPPLQRITMSGSAALEYGFPSTHSANAVSVAVYSVLVLHSPENPFSTTTTLGLESLAYFYAFSIVFGRLYCGMHGFHDVIIGSIMGAVISIMEFYYEPADDCPCFDDSVAFAGVVIGVEIGTWHLAQSAYSNIYNGPDATFNMKALGWPVTAMRVVIGVLIIFAWREVMKPTLLKGLPHLFRIIETHGLSLPRRFFKPASQYKNVPLHLRDDNVLPSVRDFPKLVRSIRGPGRGRSVSIGPQSAADAYETLAYRERRRRESIDSNSGPAVGEKTSLTGLREKTEGEVTAGAEDTLADEDQTGAWSQASGVQSGRLAEYEDRMGQGTVVAAPQGPSSPDGAAREGEPCTLVGRQDDLGEREMFSRLVKPRVRYDVEVVTKLIVYTGIGWLASNFILVIFELLVDETKAKSFGVMIV
ncbi:hypothetical protein P8C59_006382 [Phyllachora maydis]|uniref:Phosphatidic acid phosphatase type 2/haloperoxidase domain-containing protein n=1 Tax=Phyllachora maydis TaxID=1825666 RepID=A0AAD9MFG4_9PEZI|nr:hypothetical protein P8C59_006382 [Phyllachora maydis]